MAIKTQSQLDKFNNGTNSNQFDIGENMAFFKNGYLTRHDKSNNDLPISPDIVDWRTQPLDYADGRTEYNQQNMPIASNHYWSSIFEISKPTSPSSPSNNDSNEQYDSMHTTYEDILKNILWDVKTYLNWKNNLNNYNLSTIVEGTQLFTGTKYFQGKVYALSGEYDHLSAENLSAVNSKITNLTATNGTITTLNSTTGTITTLNSTTGTITNLSATNGTITALNSTTGTITTLNSTNGTITNLSATNLTAINDLRTYSNIIMNNQDSTWVNGYARGLKSDSSTKYAVGNATTPVYFSNGIPEIVNVTGKATLARYLVNSNWEKFSIGSAELLTTPDYPFAESKTVVKFVNGIPQKCNEIDYAHHAYWSDIGERYLADKEYEPGTLVKFGGEKEITIADDEVNAIVSTHAFDLNACLSGGTVICLCGRVPTKVIGKISKFDRIMLSKIPGIACKWDGSCKPIGRALESNDNEGIKLVECVSQFII